MRSCTKLAIGTSLLLAGVHSYTTIVSSRGHSSFLVATSSTATSTRRWMNPAEAAAVSTDGFILSELRDAAMKLHTKSQAPREGQAPEPTRVEPYTPTHEDYLRFLVDSQYVYQAMEDVVRDNQDLAALRNTGLERTIPLEQDITFMMKEYGLERPEVGEAGKKYAEIVRKLGLEGPTPAFMCHYYNFYFAHTAGGRMIGKQMSALLLDNKTLEFYKWEGDLKQIKDRVKAKIEAMAASWSREEKDQCVAETPAAFEDGGMINSYLMGGPPGH